jgi:hypothetical protein
VPQGQVEPSNWGYSFNLKENGEPTAFFTGLKARKLELAAGKGM